MHHPNFMRKLALLSPHQVQCDWTAVEVKKKYILLILECMISKCKNTVIINANCLYQANSNNKQGLVAHIGQDDKPTHQKEMNTRVTEGCSGRHHGEDPALAQ